MPRAAGEARRPRPGRARAEGRVNADLEGVGRFGGLSVLGLVAVVAGAVPFLALTVLVVMRWPPLARLDEQSVQRVHDTFTTHELGVQVLEVLTEVGGGVTPVLLMMVGAVWLLVRRHRELAAYVAVTGVGLAVLIPLSKELVGRTRPEVLLPVVHVPTSPSFPSGHSMTAIVVWGCLALVALPATRRSHRPWLVGVTAGIVVLTGFTRMALGVHFLTDVLAGWALGGAWLAVTVLAFRNWIAHRHLPPGHLGPEAPVRALHVRTLPEPALPDRRGTVGRLLLLFGAVAAVVSALGLLVTGPLRQTAVGRLDEEVARSWERARLPGLTEVVQTADLLAGVGGILVAGAAVAALGVAHRGSWRPAVLVLVAVAGEVLLYWLTSSVVGRARPDVEPLYTRLPIDASFPSGHVAATVAVYGSACALALAYGRGRWRWLPVAAAALLVLVSMVARVYLGAHYPTDVVAGLLLGTAWVWGVAHLLLAEETGAPHHLRWDSALPRGAEPVSRRPEPRNGQPGSPSQAGST